MLVERRERDVTLAEARTTTRRVARTFAIACRLLPREVRDDVYRLYLVFRTIDDLVDDGHPEARERVDALDAWAAHGEVGSPEALILASLVDRRGLPRGPFRDFCAGMRDDLAAKPILTEDALDLYCYRVAGTVGLVMAAVLGVRRPGAEPQAAALGMAMQRTNILRDIDEDLQLGRIYLARETVDRLGAPEPGAREALLRDQIARADRLYDEGIAGIPALACGRRAIAAAAAMYREILRQVERDGYGREPGRAVVARPRKLFVAARAGLITPS